MYLEAAMEYVVTLQLNPSLISYISIYDKGQVLSTFYI